jgi:hypothetical protein
LANSKAQAQDMAHPFMRSENPATISRAYELIQGVEEIASRGQRRIRKLLRRLAVNQEGSKTSSTGSPVAIAQAPRAGAAD